MQKEKPFGIELVAALSLIGAVYAVIYTDRNPFALFQAGFGALSAAGLWLGKPWGWWAATIRFFVSVVFSIFALTQNPAVGAFWAQLLGSLIPLIYLLLPGVRAALGVGRKR